MTAPPGSARLFTPITVGTMKLRNRVMLPPHAAATCNIYRTDEEAARNIAYFEQPARARVALVGSLSKHVGEHCGCRQSVRPGRRRFDHRKESCPPNTPDSADRRRQLSDAASPCCYDWRTSP
jgi:hypothetical protein